MIEYKKPIKFHSEPVPNSNIPKRKPLKEFLDKLLKPKPKKRDELQEIYKSTYDEVYKKERAEYLKKKAEIDAKKKAKVDNSPIGFIIEAITGGRSKP